jgi:hypothetical protein
VSGSPPPAISPPESSRSLWCCRSCLLLAAVRGAQPRGGWRPSTIARLQGFSSCSPTATSGRWSSTRMTTSLVVERSESQPPPALSFKDVHHPCSGGGRAELGSRLPHGLVACFFLQHSGRRAFTSFADEANFGYAGPAKCGCRRPPRAWFPGLAGPGAASGTAFYRLVGAWLPIHRTGDGRAVRRSATSTPAAAPGAVQDVVRRGGDVRVLGWSCPHSHSEDGSEDLFARARAAAIRRYGTGAQVAAVIGAEVVTAAGEAPHCRSGCLRWRDHQCHLPPGLRLFGFNGLVVAPRRKTGARTFSQWRTC